MNDTTEIQQMNSMSMQSTEIGALAEAMAKAQGQILGAKKETDNSYFKNKYADLAAVIEACRDALSKHGICVIQTTQVIDGKLYLETMLAHASGQWKRGLYPVRPVKDDPQGIGSALTYARRYGLAAIAGVAQIDDDGEASMGRNKEYPPINPAQPIDHKKVEEAVTKAIEIVDSDDMDAGPDAARNLVKSLTNDERIAFKGMLETFKGGASGKKSYYAMFKGYYDYVIPEATQ